MCVSRGWHTRSQTMIMIKITDFIKKYSGQVKGYPNDTYYNGECLSIVKLWMKEKYGFEPPPSGSNSAYGYWTNFPSPLGQYYTKEANTPDLVPQEEWISIWNTNAGNGYGHIEIVCDNKADKQYFNSFGQNWNGKQGHITHHNYKNVVGFLKPKEQTMADTIQVEKKVFEDLVRKSTAYDEILVKYGVADAQGLFSHVAGKQSRITTLEGELGKAKADLEVAKSATSTCSESLIRTVEQKDLLQSHLESVTKEADVARQDRDFLKTENETLKVQVDTLKQAKIEGSITITIREFITLLLNQKIKITK